MVIIGLGNYTDKYSKSRHNVGFMCLDKVVSKLNLKFKKKLFRPYLFTKVKEFTLVKPLTFMNNSGKVLPYFKKEDKIIIIVDNMDLEVGVVRVKKNSGNSTHNGLRSINKYLNNKSCYIIHIGIGKAKTSVIDHVLSQEIEKEKELEKAIAKASDIVINLRETDIESLSGTYKCI